MACFVQEGPPCRRMVLTVLEHFPASSSYQKEEGDSWGMPRKKKVQIREDDQDCYSWDVIKSLVFKACLMFD